MDLSRFPTLLDRAFLEYRIRQTRQRLSVSLNSFAGFLDFSPPIVNMWLSGNRLPSQNNVERLIPKLVDLLNLEVYDILGLPRPDQNLQRLTQAWPHIQAKFQQILAEQAVKFAAEGENASKDAVEVEQGDDLKKLDKVNNADEISNSEDYEAVHKDEGHAGGYIQEDQGKKDVDL
jgi:transcriptional regulator with XRE-family HTH domain